MTTSIPVLQLPAYAHRIRINNGQIQIFDDFRKKWLVLKPEEWVRQHMLHYLVKHLQYPASLVSQEKSLQYHALKKRSDILVYGANASPLLLVECKASNVKINQQVVDQVGIYNKIIAAKIVAVSNGITTYCWTNDKSGNFVFLNEIPPYAKISQ